MECLILLRKVYKKCVPDFFRFKNKLINDLNNLKGPFKRALLRPL